jgi:UDP-glucuronate decarboxylase
MDLYDGRVVSNFIVQALKNEPITIYGDGTQTRSFCYVDDMIEIMARFMDGPDDFPGPLNAGNPGEYSIRQLAEQIIGITGSASKLVYRDLPFDDPTQRCPDIQLAREKFDWEPRTALKEGLVKTVGYFDALLSNGERRA